MKVEWLNEARNEFREFVTYYATQVGKPYAENFQRKFCTQSHSWQTFLNWVY